MIAGNYFALMSFFHLMVIDYLANEEGNEYYTKTGSKKKSGNMLFKAKDLFSEVPATKSKFSFTSFLKSSIGGRFGAKKNPYNRKDGNKNNGTWSQYGLGYELMMVWHNMVFSSVLSFWMLQHFI